jgi:hypothetical protein
MQNNLESAILAQLELNKDTNLLYHSLEAVAKVDGEFIQTLQRAAEQPFDPDEVKQRARYAARECLRTIYQLNQYLHVSALKRDELRQLYIDSWENIAAGGDIEKVLISFHYPKLQTWLASVYPPQFLPAFSITPEIHPVLNKQYSPVFQLDLLGIDLNSLKQPILDIGCGSQGRLVRFLREMGYQAFGIDRMIDFNSDFLFEIDWFDYEFKCETWGSILSNIALSNHYQYIRRYEPDTVPLYTDLYSNILAALENNGVFYYAPPTPDLEKELHRPGYTVRTHLIDGMPYSIQVQKTSGT